MTKKLTQAVFGGLSPEYRWAAIDANGDAFAYECAPLFSETPEVFYISDQSPIDATYFYLGGDFDATDWQHSLIERDTGINASEENQALAEAQAEIEQKRKKIAQLEMLIVSESDRLNTTIRKQAAEIAALKESQSDLRGFLHEQIEKNFLIGKSGSALQISCRRCIKRS